MLFKKIKNMKRDDKMTDKAISDFKTEEENQIKKYEKPWIFSFDLKNDDFDFLKNSNYHVQNGSLGSIIELKTSEGKGLFCSVNNEYPRNIHEYDILIFDLNNENFIPYKEEEHKRKNVDSNKDYYIFCSYPKTIFNPKPITAIQLQKHIENISNKKSFLIVFGNHSEYVEYDFVDSWKNYPSIESREKFHNYSFLPSNSFLSENKNGKKINILNSKLKSIFEKYKDNIQYHVTFFHPKHYENNEVKPDGNFVPLIENEYNEIVSYVYFYNNQCILMFPDIFEKGKFLKELLEEVLPTINPDIFPEQENASWTLNEDYFLPNQKKLIKEEKDIIARHNKELENISKKINENTKEYEFLHKIIVSTGDELVENLIILLKWLGFNNITDMDDCNNGKKEEDIQIPLEDGLLIIEVKGIGGTSKDKECAQISKIRSRRCEERKSFDVFGLYIVNHQRHLPPFSRTNPPFSEDQINDANLDKRGLLTTWDLFNLFFDICNNTISKKQVREDLKKTGLIIFNHDLIEELGIVSEIYKNGEVVIININKKINKNSVLFIKKNYRYNSIKILDLQTDDKSVEIAENCEVGILINSSLKIGDKLFISK